MFWLFWIWTNAAGLVMPSIFAVSVSHLASRKRGSISGCASTIWCATFRASMMRSFDPGWNFFALLTSRSNPAIRRYHRSIVMRAPSLSQKAASVLGHSAGRHA